MFHKVVIDTGVGKSSKDPFIIFVSGIIFNLCFFIKMMWREFVLGGVLSRKFLILLSLTVLLS